VATSSPALRTVSGGFCTFRLRAELLQSASLSLSLSLCFNVVTSVGYPSFTYEHCHAYVNIAMLIEHSFVISWNVFV